MSIAPDNVGLESDGNWQANPSALGPGTTNKALGDSPIQGPAYTLPGGTGNPPKNRNAYQFKTDYNYGTNPDIANPTTSNTSPDSPVSAVKKKKKQQNDNLDDPTAAQEDPSNNIHNAILSADPSNIAGAIKGALQGMVMLKMMEKLTSPAGISSIASAALGSAFQNIGQSTGTNNLLNSLNQMMVGINSQLPPSAQLILQNAIYALLSNTSIGVLTDQSIAEANATVVSVNTAITAVNSNNSIDAVSVISSIGGPSLGIDPNSLAAQIAMNTVGGVISTTVQTSTGQTIYITIINGETDPVDSNIPLLNGNEHVLIAQQAAIDITEQLATLLGINNPLTPIAGSNSQINGNNLSSSNLASLINNAISSISSNGLQKILGVGSSDLLGALGTLLPNIGGDISNTLTQHVPKTVLDPNNMTNLMQNTTQALSLSKMAFNIAKRIFGNNNSSNSIANITNSLAEQVGSTGAPANVVLPNGGDIIASPTPTS